MRVGGKTPHQNKIIFSRLDKIMDQFFSFKCVQIYIKDVECAETDEKPIFLVFEIWSFLYSKLAIFDEFSP